LGDFLRAFDTIVEKALSEKVDFFLFAGDAFKTREPTQTQQREFAKRIKKITDANIPVILLVGNHDTSNATGKANSLDIYTTLDLPRVYVIRDLEKIEVNGLQIVGFPWLSRSDFVTAHERLKGILKSLDPDKPAIAMVHASVAGATYGSERQIMMGGDMVVDKESINHPGLAYVALGHIHLRQVIPNTKVPMVYPGSIERVDFGESKEDKGFELVTIEKSGTKWTARHIHYTTNPRPFVTIKVKLNGQSEPTDQVTASIKSRDIKDAIVKVLIDVPDGGSSDIDLGKIRQALKPAFTIAAISKNMQRSMRQSLGETVSELTVPETLDKYFTAKNIAPTRAKHLAKLAEELINDSN
jgi:exonuclease SbcD